MPSIPCRSDGIPPAMDLIEEPSVATTSCTSSLSELAVLRMNMSPTATGGFSCCAEPRSIERNLRFVRGLCLTPTGCVGGAAGAARLAGPAGNRAGGQRAGRDHQGAALLDEDVTARTQPAAAALVGAAVAAAPGAEPGKAVGAAAPAAAAAAEAAVPARAGGTAAAEAGTTGVVGAGGAAVAAAECHESGQAEVVEAAVSAEAGARAAAAARMEVTEFVLDGH